ncbi:cysteine protease ATG4A isoform X2 [Aquarana catesbeiana]|uniref:cysteine protease ATG4A isoform X2 n=1 Tax=Aquarana catesbeiana TaxID=8400 RepID=UPI003CCA5F37
MIGRANLAKMVWLPQLLFQLHNSPVWLTSKLFRTLDSTFRDLIWKLGKLRIKLETLQQAQDRGGIAVPNSRLYFFAAQLQHWCGWEEIDDQDPIQNIIMTQFKPLPLVQRIVSHRFYEKRKFPTFYLIHKLWETIRIITQHKGYKRHMPIWENFCLPEMNKIPEFLECKRAWIHFLYQIFEGDTLLPFSILKDRFQLSKVNFYQYLQIRHALQSQALTFQFQYNPSEILLKATLVRLSKRGLIGDLYHIFLNTVKGDGQAKRLIRWQKDLIDLNEDEWTRAMEILPEVSISPSQQLTQLFILHRTHYTPQKLFVWGKKRIAFMSMMFSFEWFPYPHALAMSQTP